jgi:hypothetical protein
MSPMELDRLRRQRRFIIAIVGGMICAGVWAAKTWLAENDGLHPWLPLPLAALAGFALGFFLVFRAARPPKAE